MFKLFSRSMKVLGTTKQFNEDVAVTSYGLVKLPWTQFFPASFKIKIKDKIIYIDPFLVDDEDKADIILITHSHMDHCSPKDIATLCNESTEIFCSKCSAKKIKKGGKIHVVAPGYEGIIKGVTLKTTPAYNQKRGWITAHPQKSGFVGFLISVDEYTLFHAGDSYYIPEHKALHGLSVAMLPIGGDNLTMDTGAALQFVSELSPGIVIPMHYEYGKEGEFISFAKLHCHIETLLT